MTSDEWQDDVSLQIGQASGANEADDDKPEYVAVLLIPDITERHGWRDVWIEKTKTSKPKSAGFRREKP